MVRGAGMFLIVTSSLVISAFSTPDAIAGRNLGFFKKAAKLMKHKEQIVSTIAKQASALPGVPEFAEHQEHIVSDVSKRVRDVPDLVLSVPENAKGPREFPRAYAQPEDVAGRHLGMFGRAATWAKRESDLAHEVSLQVRKQVSDHVKSFLAKDREISDKARNRLGGLAVKIQNRFRAISLSDETLNVDTESSNQIGMGDSLPGLGDFQSDLTDDSVFDFVSAEVSSAATSATEVSEEHSSEETDETSNALQNLKENVLKTVKKLLEKLRVHTSNLRHARQQFAHLDTESIKDKASELMQQVAKNSDVQSAKEGARKELDRLMESPLVEKAKNEVVDTVDNLMGNSKVKTIKEETSRLMREKERTLKKVAQDISKNKIVSDAWASITKEEPGVLSAFSNMFHNRSSVSMLLVGTLAVFVGVVFSRVLNKRKFSAKLVELSTPVV